MRRKSQKNAFLVTAQVRQVGERLSPVLFLVIALFILLATTLNGRLADHMRVKAADMAAPVLAAIGAPLQDALMSVSSIADFFSLRAENAALKDENERLKKWYQMALSLKMENESLAGLLNLVKDPSRSFITTRVITDPTGPFYRTVLVPAGASVGVKEGHAAIAAEGLVGRVTDVGENSARILMATDMNSRIPVFVGDNKTRAILAGNNSALPQLDHLPKDATVAVGDRVVTSGQGGLFAPALPVGIVESVTEDTVKIRLYTDLDGLDYLQIVDFGYQDIL